MYEVFFSTYCRWPMGSGNSELVVAHTHILLTHTLLTYPPHTLSHTHSRRTHGQCTGQESCIHPRRLTRLQLGNIKGFYACMYVHNVSLPACLPACLAAVSTKSFSPPSPGTICLRPHFSLSRPLLSPQMSPWAFFGTFGYLLTYNVCIVHMYLRK